MAKQVDKPSQERQGKVRRGLKRRTDDYTNEAYGRGDSFVPRDDRTLNEKLCPVRMVRLSYDGLTMARFWPNIDYSDPERLSPGRVNAADRGQGMWARRVKTANYVGIPTDQGGQQMTFIIARHGDKAATQKPYPVLFSVAQRAHDAAEFASGKAWDPSWNKLLKGTQGKGAQLSKPGAKWFAQGEVFVQGNVDYLENRTTPLGGDADDDLVVIQMSGSAGDAMMGLLDIRKEEGVDDVDEEKQPHKLFVHGDPCGRFNAKTGEVRGGLFFTFWNPKGNRGFKPPVEKVAHTWDGKIGNTQGYECMVTREYEYNGQIYTPSMSAEHAKLVFNRWQYWLPDPEDPKSDGLLYIPSDEEQALWVAMCFKPVAPLVRLAWSEHPEFMTAEVKAVLASRVQVARPGLEGEDMPDDEEDEVPQTRKGKKVKQQELPFDGPEDDEDEEEEEAPKKKRKASKPPVVEDDEEEEDDEEVESADEDEDDETEEPAAEEGDEDEDEFAESDEEEDEEEEAPKKKRKASKPEPEDDEEEEEEEEEDEEDAPRPSTKKKSGTASRGGKSSDEDDESEDDEEEPPAEFEEDEEPEDEEDEDDEGKPAPTPSGRKKSPAGSGAGKKSTKTGPSKSKGEPEDDYGLEDVTGSGEEVDMDEKAAKARRAMAESMAAATGRAKKRKTADVPPPQAPASKKSRK